jgi:predicted DNA-binding ribbon-helix-helix protein
LIARKRGCTVDELCGDIELNFAPGEDFTPAARRYVLRYIDQVPKKIELPSNFRSLTELRDRRRAQ